MLNLLKKVSLRLDFAMIKSIFTTVNLPSGIINNSDCINFLVWCYSWPRKFRVFVLTSFALKIRCTTWYLYICTESNKYDFIALRKYYCYTFTRLLTVRVWRTVFSAFISNETNINLYSNVFWFCCHSFFPIFFVQINLIINKIIRAKLFI